MKQAVDRLLSRLSHNFGDRLRTDEASVATVCGDESGLAPGFADAWIMPANTAEVQLIAREAHELGVPLVPRGGGTGKAGGCIPHGGIVVDLCGMNRLLEMHSRDLYAVVEPGMITADFDRAVAREGFMFPPDPSSWESSTLGGNIATNAGGPRAVKYGVTHRYVWGVEIVLPGGDVMRLGRNSIKGVAGYDLTSLLVGSEGTLGFITRATLHVIPAPSVVETAWLCFGSPLEASRAAEAIFAAGILPRMMELMDAVSLEPVRPQSPFRIPEGIGAALLVETDGDDDGAMSELVKLCTVAVDEGATETLIATSEKDRHAFRRTRRLISPCLKERYPHKLSDDIAVPRGQMVELLERASELADRAGMGFCAYGHLGDGNLHTNVLCTGSVDELEADACRLAIVEVAVSMGGTVSGEHGIGIAKLKQLTLEQSPMLIDFQRKLKRVFDPKGIMNPGKIFT